MAGVRLAIHATGGDPGTLVKLGHFFISENAFGPAELAFAAALRAYPNSFDAYQGLAALAAHGGREDQALHLSLRALRAKPVQRTARQRSDLIVARCLESGRYRIGRDKDGRVRARYKGGHFSLTGFLGDTESDFPIANLGFGETPVLPGDIRLVINTIACADGAVSSLRTLAEILPTRPGLIVVNHPAAVLGTSREANAARGCDAPVRFARTVRITANTNSDEIAHAGSFTGFPAIFRQVGTHTGQTGQLVENAAALAAALAARVSGTGYYLTAYEDCRDEGGVWRKARAFFIGGRLFPVACLGSDAWQIHSADRYRIMQADCRLQAEERNYLSDPEGTVGADLWAALGRTASATGLDFVGIDFAPFGRSRGLVFEMNPAMRHNFDHAGNFPYTRAPLQRISKAFCTMIEKKAVAR